MKKKNNKTMQMKNDDNFINMIVFRLFLLSVKRKEEKLKEKKISKRSAHLHVCSSSLMRNDTFVITVDCN